MITPSITPWIGSGKLLVASQFTDFATSGLEFKVPEQTDWQIMVEPPAARGQPGAKK